MVDLGNKDSANAHLTQAVEALNKEKSDMGVEIQNLKE